MDAYLPLIPVTSLHFWVINTRQLRTGHARTPVTSLHFWVINTGNRRDAERCQPVTSLHFWVNNTLWRVITWK